MRIITIIFVFLFAFNHLFGQQIQQFQVTTADASQNGNYFIWDQEGDCLCYVRDETPNSIPPFIFVVKTNPCTNSWSLYPGPDCSSTQPLIQLTDDLPDCNILNATPKTGISIVESPSPDATSCKDVTIDLGGSCVFMFSEIDAMTESPAAVVAGFTINGIDVCAPFSVCHDPSTAIIDLTAFPLLISCDVVSVNPYVVTYSDGGQCFGNIRIGSPVPPFPDTSECKTIPTLSQWGLIILSMLFIIFGVVGVRNRIVSLA